MEASILDDMSDLRFLVLAGVVLVNIKLDIFYDMDFALEPSSSVSVLRYADTTDVVINWDLLSRWSSQ